LTNKSGLTTIKNTDRNTKQQQNIIGLQTLITGI